MSTRHYSISTHWNAFRHSDGEAMVEEILQETSLTCLELGYDTMPYLVPGIKKAVSGGAVRVDSLHNYCPVPPNAPQGHPELFLLGSEDARSRQNAIIHTRRTIEFAAEIGAKTIVCHAGYVQMKNLTRELVKLYNEGRQSTAKYEKVKTRLLLTRDKKAKPHLAYLREGLEALLPDLESFGVNLALENLPLWESIPSETEMEVLCGEFGSPRIGYWHDIGHGQIRQNLGLISQRRWLGKLAPHVMGLHVHDVDPPFRDHVMPPHGQIDFSSYRELIPPDVPTVIEPATDTPADILRAGIEHIRAAWREAPAGESAESTS